MLSEHYSINVANMASLCSLTSRQRILNSYRRRHKDDRPFLRNQKAILPIRGFKGNRILYGDSLEAVDEMTEEEEDVDSTEFVTNLEPVYSEPQFELSDDSQISDISSGYLSHTTEKYLMHHSESTPTRVEYPQQSSRSGYQTFGQRNIRDQHDRYLSQEVSNPTTHPHRSHTTSGYCMSSPESGYLSSDEECLLLQLGEVSLSFLCLISAA